LSYILDHGMMLHIATEQVRLLPLTDNYTLAIEARVTPEVVAKLARMGITTTFLRHGDSYMGSFQMGWRDQERATLSACTDPRLIGIADGWD
jgi:hypothetical protein